MHVTIKGNLGTFNTDVSYTIGDVVRIVYPGCCLSNIALETIFGIKDAIFFPDIDEVFGTPYPKLEGNTDEWKIIDVKAHYGNGFAILLRNRSKQCVVMNQLMYGGDVLKVVRKSKRRIDALELKVI